MFDRLVQFVQDFAHLFVFWTIVHPYEEAVHLRLGKHTRTLGPGFHFVWPLRISEVLATHVTPATEAVTAHAHTADDIQATVTVLVTWSVSDVAQLLLASPEPHAALQEAAAGVLTGAVQGVLWSDLRNEEFRGIVLRDMKKRARKWGIKIKDVQVSELVRTKSLRLLSSPQFLPEQHS